MKIIPQNIQRGDKAKEACSEPKDPILAWTREEDYLSPER